MMFDVLEVGYLLSELMNKLFDCVIVFVINIMVLQFIVFFDVFVQYIDIYIFYLNFSVNYWGEVKSSSEQVKLLCLEGFKKWMEEDQLNLLFGNLGRQGRELFNLFIELDIFEISVFDLLDFEEINDNVGSDNVCGLFEYIYNDILQVV